VTQSANTIELLLPPLLAGIFLSLSTGPLGCFVVWRKMAYFGDTIAHAALLGLGLSVLLSANQIVATVLVCIAISAVLTTKSKHIHNDTVLGIIAHGSLALGLLVASMLGTQGSALNAILLGDILAAGYNDAMISAAFCLVILTFGCLKWRALLLSTVDEAIAATEGHKPQLLKFLLLVSISLTVAQGIVLVGALLVSSLLIIPAAAARFLSRSPEQMVVCATAISFASMTGGILLSALYDLPSGPLIVSTSLIFMLLFVILGSAKSRRACISMLSSTRDDFRWG